MINKKSAQPIIKKEITGKPAENKKDKKTLEDQSNRNAIAGEFISDDAKHHSQVLKRTNYGKKKG